MGIGEVNADCTTDNGDAVVTAAEDAAGSSVASRRAAGIRCESKPSTFYITLTFLLALLLVGPHKKAQKI